MYTDANIISMIIAAVMGSLIAIPAYFVLWKNKIKYWFIKKPEDSGDPDDPEPQETGKEGK